MNNDRVKLLQLRQAKQDAKAAKTAKVNARKGSTKDQDQIRQRSSKITANLQQRCLNIFRDSLWNNDISTFQETLQEVKGHLYNRDFATAFTLLSLPPQVFVPTILVFPTLAPAFTLVTILSDLTLRHPQPAYTPPTSKTQPVQLLP
jgi:hypothetical protein